MSGAWHPSHGHAPCGLSTHHGSYFLPFLAGAFFAAFFAGAFFAAFLAAFGANSFTSFAFERWCPWLAGWIPP